MFKFFVQLFACFKINNSFFEKKLLKWEYYECYEVAARIIKNIFDVNDIAPGKESIESYNGKMTKNEVQKQYLLWVVYDYWKKYLDSKKRKIICCTSVLFVIDSKHSF